jgi:hypothetical protein
MSVYRSHIVFPPHLPYDTPELRALTERCVRDVLTLSLQRDGLLPGRLEVRWRIGAPGTPTHLMAMQGSVGTTDEEFADMRAEMEEAADTWQPEEMPVEEMSV